MSLGKAFTYGDCVHYLDGGMQVDNLGVRVQDRFGSVEGFVRVDGIVLSEVGTRSIDITSGKYYRALNDLTFDGINTDTGGNTFVYHYKDNSDVWQKTIDCTQIDNTQYNDQTAASGLSDLGNNEYGVHWVYIFKVSVLEQKLT